MSALWGKLQHVLIDKARQRFQELFGTPPAGVVFAPGRVNLVGEHTDYNDGFVLPMAVQKGIALAFAPRSDDVLRVHSADVPQTRDLELAQLRHRVSVEPDRTGHRGGWFGYVAGVAWSMLGAGMAIRGADIALTGDLPMGAGLSSSAALEVGIARALVAVSDVEWDPKAIALMAQRAEIEFAGVACGIMDQLVVAAAHEDCALLIDCRSLETRDVALPRQMSVLILDSGVRRDLASSAYNERRASCERAADAIRLRHPEVIALRDADLAMLDEARSALSGDDYRRARHVILENPRPAAFSEALTAGNFRRAGEVMGESHASLRDLYDVSTPELDVLVDAAVSVPGCYGARLTGAGFGGCVVAIADVEASESVIARVKSEYSARCDRDAPGIVTRAAAGARLIR
ncbi:MAG: galactokinase [Vicinamibacterales bacterium]